MYNSLLVFCSETLAEFVWKRRVNQNVGKKSLIRDIFTETLFSVNEEKK
jgi:hypothetical protein